MQYYYAQFKTPVVPLWGREGMIHRCGEVTRYNGASGKGGGEKRIMNISTLLRTTRRHTVSSLESYLSI